MQLKQRISLKSSLVRLSRDETARYVLHRLNLAGAAAFDIFTKTGLRAVYRYSDGIPRMINHVCENAMMLAAKRNIEKIDGDLVNETVKQGLITPVAPLTRKKPEKQIKIQKEAVSIQTIDNEPESDKFGFIDINELITVL
ncbi:MAG: hypothetical protein U5R06_09930 [candidate division KSB1 bacterium]|nr:hypothetical protein [candidate division KSB1 bacterium]